MGKGTGVLVAPTLLTSRKPRGAAKCHPETFQWLFPVQSPKGTKDNRPRERCQLSSFPSPLLCPPSSCSPRPAWSSETVGSAPKSSEEECGPHLPPLPHQMQRACTEVMTGELHGWGWDAGCRMLMEHPQAPQGPAVGWAGGWQGKQPPWCAPDRPAQPQRCWGALGASLHLPNKEEKGGKKPAQEGGEANWFDFRSAAPSWLRFCPLTIPFASFKQ